MGSRTSLRSFPFLFGLLKSGRNQPPFKPTSTRGRDWYGKRKIEDYVEAPPHTPWRHNTAASDWLSKWQNLGTWFHPVTPITVLGLLSFVDERQPVRHPRRCWSRPVGDVVDFRIPVRNPVKSQLEVGQQVLT